MPITDGLKALWPFDGNPNDIQDSHNFAVTAGAPTYPVGKHNQCILTDGVADYLTMPYSTDFEYGTGKPWTCTGWVNVSDAITGPGEGLEIILCKGNTGGVGPRNQWFLGTRYDSFRGHQVLSFFMQAVDGTRSIGDFLFDPGTGPVPSTVNPGVWRFFAVGVRDDGSSWTQIDCEARYDFYSLASGHLWTIQSPRDLLLGARLSDPDWFGPPPLPGNYYHGKTDEVYYWNRALSDAELGQLCSGLFLPFNTRASVWAG